jgi:hypothetical protein
MKTEKQVVTVADLLARADELKKKDRKRKKLEIVGFGVVEIIEPTAAQMEDSLKLGADEGAGSDGDAHLVAECIVSPSMKDPALLGKFGVPTPDELVKVLFRQGDRAHLAKTIMSFGGYDGSGVKEIETIKN